MNKTYRTALVALFAVLFVSIASLQAFAKEKFSLESYWKDSGKSYPAGKNFTKPGKWAPGQYVLVGTKVKDKLDSVSRTLIVAKEGDGWIIESDSVDKKGKKNASQMLIKGYDAAMETADLTKIKVEWMKMKDDEGNVQTIEGEQMAIFNMFAKKVYESLIINIDSFKDGGAVTVPAGTFAGTNLYTSKTKVLGMTIENDSWYNAAVPVNGMVKSVTKDGKTVMELLDFGTNGTSVF